MANKQLARLQKRRVNSDMKNKKDEADIMNMEKGNRYLSDFLKDRQPVIFLYLVTLLLFTFVCSLYQMDNMYRLLYASLLSTVIWLAYGVTDYRKYYIKRKKIALADENLVQAVELLTNDSLQNAVDPEKGRGSQNALSTPISELEKAYEELISRLCREHSRLETQMEQERSDRNDYYLMWAHQIKTPIAGMKLLLNGREDSFLLLEELFKIEQYVEMVLQYHRLDSISSDMVLKEYQLYELVKQTVKKFSILFINSGLSLKLEEFIEVKVLTDAKWLCFVLDQILSNSIKYTKKGRIRIYMLQGSSKTLVIEDTGIGIRSEDLPRIFERGFTGYNGRMDKKSTGIGLYLCKSVMKQLAHGIHVESREGIGTSVYLDLSRSKEIENY